MCTFVRVLDGVRKPACLCMCTCEVVNMCVAEHVCAFDGKICGYMSSVLVKKIRICITEPVQIWRPSPACMPTLGFEPGMQR